MKIWFLDQNSKQFYSQIKNLYYFSLHKEIQITE